MLDINDLMIAAHNAETPDAISDILTKVKAKNQFDNVNNVIIELVKNPNITPEILKEIFEAAKDLRYGKQQVFEAIAGHKNTTLEILEKIVEEAKKFTYYLNKRWVFEKIAGNPNITEKILEEIVEETKGFESCNKRWVFEAVASHPKTSAEILKKIVEEATKFTNQDYKRWVFEAVASHPKTSAEILAKIVEAAKGFESYNKQQVFAAMVGNPNITPEILEKIFNTSLSAGLNSTHLFAGIVSNPKTPDNIMPEAIQETLFNYYRINNNNATEFKNAVQSALNINNDQSLDELLKKAYAGMKYVSGGKALTDENKQTLKSNPTWIDWICHILQKCFTLTLAKTRKESKDDFEHFKQQFVEKLKNNRHQGAEIRNR